MRTSAGTEFHSELAALHGPERSRSPSPEQTVKWPAALAILVSLVALPPVSTLLAATHIVPQDFPTIQEAIDASALGDSILLRTSFLEVTATIQINKPNLTISGLGYEPMPVVYWSSPSTDEIFNVSASDCTVEGLHLASGPGQPRGLVISLGTNGTSVIGNHFDGLVRIVENGGSDSVLSDNVFEHCVDGVRIWAGSAIIDNNVFEFCGRCIVVESPTTISNNQFLRNGWCDFGCNVTGVGIFAQGIAGNLTISGNFFGENWATGYSGGGPQEAHGGGIYLLDCQDVTLDANVFRANQAKLGAALFALDTNLEATNNVFVGNYDQSNWPENPEAGYGSIAYLSNCSATVIGNTLAGNESSAGSAFYATMTTLEFSNNILSHTISSSPGIHCTGAGGASFSCNVFWENEGGLSQDACSVSIGVDGNLVLDPMYCNFETRDLSLRPDSPCTPENAPPGCGQIGALPVDCEVGSSPDWIASLASARIYPNPSSDLPVLQLTDGPVAGPLTVRIYDAAGRAVTGKASVASWAESLRLRDVFPHVSMGPGTYFVRVADEAMMLYTLKFTVVR